MDYLTSMMKQSFSNPLLLLACTVLCVMSACSKTPSNDIVAEGEAPVRISDSYSFTEGPAVDAKGDVFFTDQPNNKIYRWDCESGEITLFTDQSGRSNGMYFDAQGNLIACADMDNQLWSFDMRSTSGRLLPQGRKNGHSKILITDFGGKLLNGPIPEDWTANVCFGGKERDVLFITASKSVYTLKMLVHGVN